eukprot:9476565-Pyramimonas_sp.AAC.1
MFGQDTPRWGTTPSVAIRGGSRCSYTKRKTARSVAWRRAMPRRKGLRAFRVLGKALFYSTARNAREFVSNRARSICHRCLTLQGAERWIRRDSPLETLRCVPSA